MVMSDDGIRPVPTDGELSVDPVLADRLTRQLAASYAAVPTATVAECAACATAVLEAAGRARGARGAFQRRWWWGGVAAAVLVLAVARPWNPRHLREQAVGAPASDPIVVPEGGVSEGPDGVVRFALRLPDGAKAVSLVGDFNGWDAAATPMARSGSGAEWSAQLPLSPGRHAYAFVIDGTQWIVDPMAPQVPDADLGPTNAVIVEGAF
jgi:hypothetical protein